jgi:hypothetical protein
MIRSVSSSEKKNRAVLQNKNKVKIIGKSVKYLVLIEFFLVENNNIYRRKTKIKILLKMHKQNCPENYSLIQI